MGKLFKNGIGSWKTTIAGMIGAVSLALPQVQALLDSDPATVCDWNIIVGAVTVLIGFIAARDGDKSSEDVGVK